jgi:uncharacterized membrane protein
MARKKPSSSISFPAEDPVAQSAPHTPEEASQTATVSFHHSGPLPDPRTFEYYERVCRGAARDIIEMAKVEQKHRHSDILLGRFAHILGQVFAFALAMTGISGGIFLVYSGKDITGFGVFDKFERAHSGGGLAEESKNAALEAKIVQ